MDILPKAGDGATKDEMYKEKGNLYIDANTMDGLKKARLTVRLYCILPECEDNC